MKSPSKDPKKTASPVAGPPFGGEATTTTDTAKDVDFFFKGLFAALEKHIQTMKDERQGLPSATRPLFGMKMGRVRDALDTAGRAYGIWNRVIDLDSHNPSDVG